VTAGAVAPPSTPAPAPDGAPAGSPRPSAASSAEPAPAAPSPSDERSDEHDSWIGAPIFGGGSPTSPDKAALLGDDEGGSPMGLLVSVTAGMGMLLVAILLARRRSRHDEPVLAGVAATAATTDAAIPTIPLSVPIPDDGPVPNVRPLPPMRELIPPVNPALLDEDEGQDAGDGPREPSAEQGIPRWLRPSVREARFANDRDHRRSNWG
jgi:hypothetical protein